MSETLPPQPPVELRTTALDVVFGLFTAGLAALLAITIFTVRDAFGLRYRGPRVNCAK